MITPNKYTTAAAMRIALEHRLNTFAKENNRDLERLRRHVAFDRFLARLFFHDIKGLTVKGGYTLELRIDRARTTKDIDFAFTGDLGGVWKGKPENLQDFLFIHLQVDLNDFFEFLVGPATLDLENAPYGGYRYPIEAKLAGRRFTKFSIDIAAGDVWYEPHEKIPTHDWLDFAGIPPATVSVICAEQQFAEKLHSYTLEREHPNSRVKDIVDMVLLIKEFDLSNSKLLEVTKKTFAKRLTGLFPPPFPDAPSDWAVRYPPLAKSCKIDESLEDAVKLIRNFCKPLGLIQ